MNTINELLVNVLLKNIDDFFRKKSVYTFVSK
jgi:hypothetical protein